MDNDDFKLTIGISLLLLSIFVGISLLSFTINRTGNVLAKQCIAKGQQWLMADRQQANSSSVQYECRK